MNIGVVRYEASEARRHNSELLLADSIHTRSDVYATIGVLVSLAGVRLGYPAARSDRRPDRSPS